MLLILLIGYLSSSSFVDGYFLCIDRGNHFIYDLFSVIVVAKTSVQLYGAVVYNLLYHIRD